MQNADGCPHFAYFDADLQLSFVWDGRSDHIEVCYGGYGEPVSDRLPVDLTTVRLTWPAFALMQFQVRCEQYVAEKLGLG